METILDTRTSDREVVHLHDTSEDAMEAREITPREYAMFEHVLSVMAGYPDRTRELRQIDMRDPDRAAAEYEHEHFAELNREFPIEHRFVLLVPMGDDATPKVLMVTMRTDDALLAEDTAALIAFGEPGGGWSRNYGGGFIQGFGDVPEGLAEALAEQAEALVVFDSDRKE